MKVLSKVTKILAYTILTLFLIGLTSKLGENYGKVAVLFSVVFWVTVYYKNSRKISSIESTNTTSTSEQIQMDQIHGSVIKTTDPVIALNGTEHSIKKNSTETAHVNGSNLLNRLLKVSLVILVIIVILPILTLGTINYLFDVSLSQKSSSCHELTSAATRVGNSVYYIDEQAVYVEELASHVYQGGTFFTSSRDCHFKVENADPNTFSALGFRYGKDTNRVFFHELSTSVDPITAEPFNIKPYYYLKDKNSVYYRGVLMESSDPSSFNIIEIEWDKEAGYYIEGNILSKDKNSVYYRGKKVEGVDMETLSILSEPNPDGVFYLKDKNSVWAINRKIENADVTSFTVLNGPYAEDVNSVYLYGYRIDVDVATFESLQYNYFRDKKGIYCPEYIGDGEYQLLTIPNADPNTFMQLNKNYSKDYERVYYSNCSFKGYYSIIIPGADVESFEVLSDYKAKDKNHLYEKEKRKSGLF